MIDIKDLTILLIWLEKEKQTALESAEENWPEDSKFIDDLSNWFDQIGLKIYGNPPESSVDTVVVREDDCGQVIDVLYEYKKDRLAQDGEIQLRLTTSKDI
jgi:hypothetical protein